MSNKENRYPRDYDHWKREMALRFLQECGFEIEELTAEAWNCFKCIDPEIYVIPLIKRDAERGVAPGILQRRYRMSWYKIRNRIDTDIWNASSHRNEKLS